MNIEWYPFSEPAPAWPGTGFLPLPQHPLYARAVALCGGQGATCVISDGARVLARAQVLQRRLPVLGKIALLSLGPVWAEGLGAGRRAAVLRAMRRAARADGCAALLITPQGGGDASVLYRQGALPLWPAQDTALLWLSAQAALMRGRMHGKWRNRLARAGSAGLAVQHRPFEPSGDAWLLAEELATRRQHGYRALPIAFTIALARARPEAARLFLARRGGQDIAAMLFLRHGAGASYHIGWSGPDGRRCNAHNLLLWHAMRHFAQAGCEALDLGRIDPRRAPGLARFKLGAGARLHRTGPTLMPLALPGILRPARSRRVEPAITLPQ